MRKFNFSYDKEYDNLFLFRPKSKSKGSIELGDLVFDYNNKKELVGIQIMNASKLISEIINEDTNTIKRLLFHLNNCKIDVKPHNNILMIKIFLLGESREISPVIPIPNIRESSPALAYA